MWAWWLSAAILAALFSGVLWPMLALLAVSVTAALAPNSFPRWLPNTWVSLAMALAFAYGMIHLHWAMSDRWPQSRHGEAVSVTGRVATLPDREVISRFGQITERQRFVFVADGQGRVPRDLRLRVTAYDAPMLYGGETIHLDMRVYRHDTRVNADGIDWLRQWLSQRIHGRAVADRVQIITPAAGVIRHRAALSSYLSDNSEPYSQGGAVLSALIVADRGAVLPYTHGLFQRTGTAHLLAISGLHVSLAAGWVWWLSRWLLLPLLAIRWQWLHRGSLALIAWFPALAVATGYAALSGFALSTQRALLMLVLFAVAQSCRYPLGIWRSLGIALFAVLLLDPLAALGPSLWLSFSAVAAIALLSQGWRRAMVMVALPALMGVVTLAIFDQWSWSAPLANLLLVPLYSVLIIPLGFLATALNIPQLVMIVAWLIEQSLACMALLSDWHHAIQGPPPEPLSLLCGLLALALLAMPWLPLPRRYLVPLLFLPWWHQGPLPLAEGDLELTLFDAAPKRVMAVRSQDHVLLIDMSPDGHLSSIDPAVTVWLRRQKLQLDKRLGNSAYTVLSKPGRLQGWRSYEQIGSGLRAQPCVAGHHWYWNQVRFEFLWPAGSGPQPSDNRHHCVLLVTSPATQWLFSGGLTQAENFKILNRLSPVALLQLPYPGAGGDALSAMLNVTRPDWLITTNADERFLSLIRDPSPHAAQIPSTLTPDREGMIVFRWRATDNAPHIKKWRHHKRRPWHDETLAWRLW